MFSFSVLKTWWLEGYKGFPDASKAIYKMNFCLLFNAGLNPATMRGSKTGVYIGVSGSEAAEAFSRDPEELLGYSMTGCQHAMLANRLSYFFDFTGMHTFITSP